MTARGNWIASCACLGIILGAMCVGLSGCTDDTQPDLPNKAKAFIEQCRKDGLSVAFKHYYININYGWQTSVTCTREFSMSDRGIP